MDDLIKQQLKQISSEAEYLHGTLLHSNKGKDFIIGDSVNRIICLIDNINNILNKTFPHLTQIKKILCRFSDEHIRTSLNDGLSALSQIIGTTKSIFEFDNNNSENKTKIKKDIEYPQKITLAWLSKHAPVSWWFWLIGSIIAIFSSGVQLSSTSFIKEIYGKKIELNHSGKTIELEYEELKLLKFLYEIQSKHNLNKMIISKEGILLKSQNKIDKDINIIRNFFGISEVTKEKTLDFENLILKIPDVYLKNIPETRLNSPYVLLVTEEGIKYLSESKINVIL